MALVFDAVHRLEADPDQTDLARGFTAAVADPAWLLGRQWQLGEHQGEDASSPVRVTYRARHSAVDPVGGQPGYDPRTTPAEAIVESEPGDVSSPCPERLWREVLRRQRNELAMVATYLPAVLLSGFLYEIASMPVVLRAVTFVVPARYYVVVTRGIFLKGVGLEALWPQAVFMLLFAAVGVGLATSVFRKEIA